MKDLAEIITDELFRQCTHGKGALVIERLPVVDREPNDDGLRIHGKIDFAALALAIETAQADSDIGRIEASIAKGARRSKGHFKP